MGEMTLVFILVPAVFVLLMTIISVRMRVGADKLFVFYALMLAAMILAAFVGGTVGALANREAGAFIGMIAGGAAGLCAGLYSCDPASGLCGNPRKVVLAVGAIIGAYVSAFTGALAGMQNYWSVTKYVLFFLAVEVVCFIVVYAVAIITWIVQIFLVVETSDKKFDW